MGRTFSLLGLTVFTVGVVVLSSLARGARKPAFVTLSDKKTKRLNAPPRRVIPVFAYDAPFSLN